MKKILIIDDDPLNLKFMGSMLEAQGYQVEHALNGREGIEKANRCLPDVILLDIMMPDMDGYEVCRRLKREEDTLHVPVILVTALEDREARLTGFKAGADEFLTKPVDRVELTLRIQNLVKVKEYEDFLRDYGRTLEATVRQRTKELETAFRDIEIANAKIKAGYLDTIYRLTMAAEYKDEFTANHLKRMSAYCRRLAETLGMARDFLETIFYAAPMHDIGKIGIPDAILLKPGTLTPAEFELTKNHTLIGGNLLNGSESPIIQMAERIALSHHEKWDGSGYPFGLNGETIPIEGRILTIVDQYDALTSRRPYKPPFPHEEAVQIITEGDSRTSPEHFDHAILHAFKQIAAEFRSIHEELRD